MSRYSRARRAHYPSLWPAVAVAVVAVLVAVMADPRVGLGGMVLDVAVNGLRWLWWRGRHPVVSFDQWVRL